MKTLLLFHAHPAGESIATGGIMLGTNRDGRRVVLVTATRSDPMQLCRGDCPSSRRGSHWPPPQLTSACRGVLAGDRSELSLIAGV